MFSRVATLAPAPDHGRHHAPIVAPISPDLDVGLSALLTDIAMCINYYRLFSPGLYCCVHATVQLDEATEFCPGIVVQVNHGPLKLCDPDPW